MPRTTQPARTYPRFTTYTAGPWTGMRDADEPAAATPGKAKSLVNCYATTSPPGTAVTGIPGFALVGSQQGSGGARAAQWIGQFSTAAGTEKSIAIINGTIVEYDWGADSFTTLVSAANLATASVTFSATVRVHCVMFFDELIISDGVNAPFSWDGTSGAGGVTPASNAPALYGQPVVYYSKLFGILAADRSAIGWSEEGIWDTGWEAGGYTNAWTLAGTKGERLVALGATNDSLTVFRPRSTTTITGAVNDAFATTGTRSSVSDDYGTQSPSGVCVLDEGLVTVDADARPQFVPRGSGYAQRPTMWDDCAVTIGETPRNQLGNVQVLVDPATRLIWVGLPTAAESHMSLYVLFERTGSTPACVGVVSGFTAQRMGVWYDTAKVPYLVHAGEDDGYFYTHGAPGGSFNNFGFAAGDEAIPHEVVTEALGADLDAEKTFDEMSAEFVAGSLTVTIGYTTPRGASVGQQVTATGGSVGGRLGSFILGTDVLGSATAEQRVRVGTSARGRWARLRLAHEELGEEFKAHWMRATAFIDGREPAVP